MLVNSLKRSTYLVFASLLGLLAYSLATNTWRPRIINGSIKRFSTTSSGSSTINNTNLSSKYNVAVAFQPKERDENKLVNEHFKVKKLDCPSGEDNLFVAKRNQDELAVGVADGVGGWSDLGFDSSAIARELCDSIGSLFTTTKDQSKAIEPKYLLDEAFKKIQNEKKVEVGGTTACLGVFKPDGSIKIANLGDSWCGVFRNHRLILESKVQTHGFNTPYQLAIIPDIILNRESGAKFIRDQPSSADEYEFQLEKNDVVLFATDGVIDNIDVKDIEIFLKDNEKTELNELAKSFVNQVHELSLDETFPSIFSQELSKLTGQYYSGGKEDDITAVFVKVIE